MQVKTAHWGDLTDDESSDSDVSSDDAAPEAPLTQEQLEAGIASGVITGLASSLEGGIDTEATLELRKQSGTSTGGPTPALFTVLEQQQAGPSAGLSAVGHTYRVPDAQGAQQPSAGAGPAGRRRCAQKTISRPVHATIEAGMAYCSMCTCQHRLQRRRIERVCAHVDLSAHSLSAQQFFL